MRKLIFVVLFLVFPLNVAASDSKVMTLMPVIKLHRAYLMDRHYCDEDGVFRTMVRNGNLKHLKFMYDNGWDGWFAFPLNTDGVTTINKKSYIKVVFEEDGRQFSVRSREIVFCKGWGRLKSSNIENVLQYEVYSNLSNAIIIDGIKNWEWTEIEGQGKYPMGYVYFGNDIDENLKIIRWEENFEVDRR